MDVRGLLAKQGSPMCLFFVPRVSEHKYAMTKMLMDSSHWRPSLHTHGQTIPGPHVDGSPGASRRGESLPCNHSTFNHSSPASSDPDKHPGSTDTGHGRGKLWGWCDLCGAGFGWDNPRAEVKTQGHPSAFYVELVVAISDLGSCLKLVVLLLSVDGP